MGTAERNQKFDIQIKRGVPEKVTMMKQQKQKKKGKEVQNLVKNRFLISVNVLGSAGPLRFVVNEDDSVSAVIETALKLYSRERRLPVLGSDFNNFLLYSANSSSDALNQCESIGSCKGRNFVMCKKQRQPAMSEGRPEMVGRKASGNWKAWFSKSFNFNILSHH